VDLAINTSSGKAALLRQQKHGAGWLAMILPILPLLLVGGPRRRRRIMLLVLLVLIAAALLSCGGSGSSSTPAQNSSSFAPPTPSNGATSSGTYTVLVHAVSGSQESSTSVQLTVQ
jgi:hypothetical protein